MSQHLKTRIAKLEQWRAPRPPYVVRVSDPTTPADRAAIAAAGRPIVVLPHKCSSTEEWSARYSSKGMIHDSS
jgi:hypothetical protein